MSEKKSLRDPNQTAGLLAEILNQARLILLLLRDGRVSTWPKLIIPATLAYIISPIDLIPDPALGLGQLDDVAVLLIGLKLFIELCPTHIVREHLEGLSSVVNASYRVVKEEEDQKTPPPLQLSAADEQRSAEELPSGNLEP